MNAISFYGAARPRPRIRFLASAKDIVESQESDDLEIVLLPPELANQGIDSDEEGNDNILNEECLPDEIAGEVEVHGGDFEDEEVDTNPRRILWRKNDNVTLGNPEKVQKSNEVFIHGGKSMYEIFLLFFSDAMITLLVDQTNLYATRDKNMANFGVDHAEMRKFLSLLLISEYHSLPLEKDYWSTAEDLEAPIFSKTMSRDRFRSIKACLHIADNHNLAQLKVAKVLPLLDLLKANCQQFGVFHKSLSIDESMVPYRGLHSAKQYIKGEPVKFGYKLWMLCSGDGFLYNFEIYCGKDSSRTSPLASHVVKKMLGPVPNKSQHIVFFDNFFTSHTLLTDIAAENVKACNTIRDNRTGHCPLMSKKDCQKKPRGTFDFRSDGSVVCVKWNNNCPVTVASNYCGVNPIQKVEKRVKNEQKKIVDQPFLIKMYNQGMGGIDVCDKLLLSYRPRLRSRKWWWNLFSHIVNLSVVAAFKFYNHINSDCVSHIVFRREIARALIKVECPRKRLDGRTTPPSKAVRFDGINHNLESVSQERCTLCKKNTRLCCVKYGKKVTQTVQ